MMSHWTMQVSNWQVIGPVMLNGVGGGLLGPQLSAISLTTVPRERMGYASSLLQHDAQHRRRSRNLTF